MKKQFEHSVIAVAVASALLAGCNSSSNDSDPLSCEWPQVVNADETACIDGRNLHVASPDWRDQVIYFAMTDRFNDGDPSNNDVAGLYSPERESHYSGGDLKGVTDKIDYIKGLGATAVWITPPVANQWWSPRDNFSGYHGYWARNFKQVDEHYGTLDDYKDLSHELHENDMYLVQDVVANHVGNYFHYDGDYNPEDTAENFVINEGATPVTAPTQAPFDMNDRTNPEHAAANIYHWTPDIVDFQDRDQELNHQLQSLDDLNTENPVVIAAMKDSFGYWIKEVGVDAFRVDTAKFVDHGFWNHFFHDQDGIEAAAVSTGREDFHYFGEVWESSDELDNIGEQKIATYLGTPAAPEFKALLSFPLHVTINRTFSEGASTANLSYRLQQHMEMYNNPWVTPNFIDNHDMARFLAKGTLPGMKQALASIFTVPGIPIVYQGTEQALTEPRQAMFAGGHKHEGEVNEVDLFDTDSEMYQFISELANIRTSNQALTRGNVEVLNDNPATSGVFAYKRSCGEAADCSGDDVYVVFNTSEGRTLLNGMPTGLAEGSALSLLKGEGHDSNVTIGAEGLATVILEPRSFMILKDEGQSGEIPGTPVDLRIDQDFSGQTLDENQAISGSVSVPNAPLLLVLDGNLDGGISFNADANGNWSTNLLISGFLPGVSEHSFEVVYADQDSLAATPTQRFTADVHPEGVEIVQMDPSGDDNGPAGTYSYPLDASFTHQQDIEETTVFAAGSTLEVTFKMNEITTSWAPTNGFDHVSFHIYLDLPNREGLTLLPKQNASTPAGFNWDLGHEVAGWSNVMFGTDGATPEQTGDNLAYAPEISVDLDAGTIKFTYDGTQLGISTWADVKVFASTWDIDGLNGALRGFGDDDDWKYGGGDDDNSPKMMDQIEVIEIPFQGERVNDEAGDEAYAYPADSSFTSQQDILQASVSVSGSNLNLSLKMAEVTDTWAPTNGFDHAAITVFIEVPDADTGTTIMPFLNGDVPAGMNWNVMSLTEGWVNAAYSSENAETDAFGDAVTPAPIVTVDKEAGVINFLYSAETLGNPLSLSGARIYVTTWDRDGLTGTYRGISPDGGDWVYGGGNESSPKVMDAVFIELP